MCFKKLEDVVRIGRGIAVIEPGDKTDVEDVVAHAVNEAAAERVVGKRKSQRVNDAPGLHRASGTLPQLLYAGGIHLRLAVLLQIQSRNGLLCKRASRPFAEYDDLR